jgi:hypothetical protein
MNSCPPPPATSSSSIGYSPIEADRSRLNARQRPVRGLKTLRSEQVVSAGYAFIQDIHCSHYELGIEASSSNRLSAPFAELGLAI